MMNIIKNTIEKEVIGIYDNDEKESYFSINKERLTKHRQEPVKCSKCSKIIKRASIYAHKKSKACQKIQDKLARLEKNEIETF